MSNDQRASQLISKSLRHQLDTEEAAEVEANLQQSAGSRRFAKLSKAIEESVSEIAGMAEEGDDSVCPGLSGDAKKRLRSSVRDAILRNSGSTDGTASGVSAPTLITSSGSGSRSGMETRQTGSRFNIVRKLGEGGLGTVWLARDEKLRRTVAIKEMKPAALESEVAWQRFHREAEITGHLEHPGIVPLYQFGLDSETQQPFYAMRFVGKRTLQDAIREHHDRGPCRDKEGLRLHRLLGDFLRVCQAIAYAHSRGVIHRDLKPENVAIDSFGQVTVLDWGLARVLESAEIGTHLLLNESSDDSLLGQTMAGEVVGTPLYMSPEQAAGDLDAIDERTDVYGLGAILFSILTGHAPHERTAEMSESDVRVKTILKAIASGETPRPSDYGSCIPRELESICVRAMERRQYLRFESATELAEAVERWMAGQTNRAGAYETLRMEGRELKNDFGAVVEDLESNVRFASLLPPIQQLIRPDDDNDENIWRDRLATIYTGLLRAKPAFSRIVFSKIEGDEFSEIVRVERHSRDRSTVRKVPKSRLRSGTVNDFIRKAMANQPEEVVSSLVCDPLCEKGETCQEPQLVAGLPVFDDETEELFGVIMIDCDLGSIFDRQLKSTRATGTIMAACDTFHTLMHAEGGRAVEGSGARPVAELHPEFAPAIEALQTDLEYIDDTDQAVYGVRLWLVDRVHGLMYLLKVDEED